MAKLPTIRIGILAREAGVSPDTIRYYERERVLPKPQRRANGYREYPASWIDRVRLVRRALAVGFTLRELARIFEERDRGGAPCRAVHALVREKLADVEARLLDLTSLRERLRGLLKEWDERMSRTPGGKRARLLESLPARPLRTPLRAKQGWVPKPGGER